MGFLTCMNSGSKSRERSSEKKNLDNGFRWGTLSVRFFVDSVDMEVWWAVEHICLGFKREVKHGFENHRKNEGLIPGSFSPVSSLK